MIDNACCCRERRVITLLTDFGLDDEYVGVMKGVILSRSREVLIVDITHQIPRHDIVQAALALDGSFVYFPRGSVHVAVVDPGVGGSRRIICVESQGHYFLAPDNGLLTLVLQRNKVKRIHAVTDAAYFLLPVSATFHGRDIFAPVAAHLTAGLPMTRLGKALSLEDLVQIDFPRPYPSPDGTLTGRVMSVDHFGNLITNVDRETLDAFAGEGGGARVCVRVGDLQIEGVSAAYNAAPAGSPVAVIGSKNRLEISVNQADASARVGDDRAKVTLTLI